MHCNFHGISKSTFSSILWLMSLLAFHTPLVLSSSDRQTIISRPTTGSASSWLLHSTHWISSCRHVSLLLGLSSRLGLANKLGLTTCTLLNTLIPKTRTTSATSPAITISSVLRGSFCFWSIPGNQSLSTSSFFVSFFACRLPLPGAVVLLLDMLDSSQQRFSQPPLWR